MNAKKFCYTIFSNADKGDLEFDLLLNGESIPYFENLPTRASPVAHGISQKKTLTNIYCALIRSIFDYSFFSVVCVSNTNLERVQKETPRIRLYSYYEK